MSRVPKAPPEIPRRGGSLTRAFGLTGMGLCRWHMATPIPAIEKALVVAAPHSSNWDAVIGFLAAFAANIDFHWMGKDSVFRGPFGPILRGLGGIAIDRSHAQGVVGQSIDRLRRAERLWLALAPEGTRRVVPEWRSGFWHIARGAGVPIVPVYLHYPGRCLGFMEPFEASADRAADLAHLKALYAPWKGKRGSGKD